MSRTRLATQSRLTSMLGAPSSRSTLAARRGVTIPNLKTPSAPGQSAFSMRQGAAPSAVEPTPPAVPPGTRGSGDPEPSFQGFDFDDLGEPTASETAHLRLGLTGLPYIQLKRNLPEHQILPVEYPAFGVAEMFENFSHVKPVAPGFMLMVGDSSFANAFALCVDIRSADSEKPLSELLKNCLNMSQKIRRVPGYTPLVQLGECILLGEGAITGTVADKISIGAGDISAVKAQGPLLTALVDVCSASLPRNPAGGELSMVLNYLFDIGVVRTSAGDIPTAPTISRALMGMGKAAFNGLSLQDSASVGSFAVVVTTGKLWLVTSEVSPVGLLHALMSCWFPDSELPRLTSFIWKPDLDLRHWEREGVFDVIRLGKSLCRYHRHSRCEMTVFHSEDYNALVGTGAFSIARHENDLRLVLAACGIILGRREKFAKQGNTTSTVNVLRWIAEPLRHSYTFGDQGFQGMKKGWLAFAFLEDGAGTSHTVGKSHLIHSLCDRHKMLPGPAVVIADPCLRDEWAAVKNVLRDAAPDDRKTGVPFAFDPGDRSAWLRDFSRCQAYAGAVGLLLSCALALKFETGSFFFLYALACTGKLYEEFGFWRVLRVLRRGEDRWMSTYEENAHLAMLVMLGLNEVILEVTGSLVVFRVYAVCSTLLIAIILVLNGILFEAWDGRRMTYDSILKRDGSLAGILSGFPAYGLRCVDPTRKESALASWIGVRDSASVVQGAEWGHAFSPQVGETSEWTPCGDDVEASLSYAGGLARSLIETE